MGNNYIFYTPAFNFLLGTYAAQWHVFLMP